MKKHSFFSLDVRQYFVLSGKNLSHLCRIYLMTDRPSMHLTVIYYSLSFKNSVESHNCNVRLFGAVLTIFTETLKLTLY